ncbi:MAG: hypothetical protein E4H43_02795 [Bacteroidia bacterium]|nr:MAG: hypothetical protein E4H43_02795 [Bacteroidia bacterium]
MNGLIRISLFILFAVCFSCEDMGWITDCSECTSNEPREGFLIIKLTGNVSPVLVNVYEGEIEDSVLYAFASITGEKYTPGINLNKKYTVTATYNIDNKTYIAVDSAIPKVKYTEDQCENPCYFIYDRVIDLRIKYTAE